MNIVGKMLVIFNLIFALVVGGFLIIDVGTRKNWKIHSEGLERELKVSRLNYETSFTTLKDLSNKLSKAEGDRDKAEEKVQLDTAILKTQIEQLKLDSQVEVDKAKLSDSQRIELLGNNTRLVQESKDLHDLLKKKDELILAMENDNKTYRQDAFYQMQIAKSMQTRNEYLLKENRRLMKLLAEKDATPLAMAISKDPNQPNPPPAYVKGVVEKVDQKEQGPVLALISLGSDHGVSEGNTLDIYRLKPRPMYLGTVRLVDVHPHKSVGQLMNESGGVPARIQVGDEVASDIASRK